ncbi:flagellar hook capping protein [Neoasaia chiangmaiensis NBRC 101099]|uniref:flagellar hook assembly protein FlgD n=1 Tax=Neoasaia chiangmaiensis TaxID=320497 RepID=UPI00098A53CB|nr:flagellar hook assembly protein FlgD [Neoasaia chiangmaiensis]GBR40375.1 flagellar hook capping protein [Neoasaia chiangmaiensis NBRC 101099]GEN13929.1 flagellar hook assembly protein [Neoasaia chiangmaiensis]
MTNISLYTAASNAAFANTSSSSSGETTSASQTSLSNLGDNYNQFLTLLTTQLQYQDPSNPMSSDNFTSELAQFAGVEQQVKTNSNLQSLISAVGNSDFVTSSNLIGKTAVASSSQFSLKNGSASVSFDAQKQEETDIVVKNGSGSVVKTDEMTSSAGRNLWSWNGRDNGGNQLPDGVYQVGIAQENTDGSISTLTPNIESTISGIIRDTNGESAELGGLDVNVQKISSVY